jgi:hypothetical protein
LGRTAVNPLGGLKHRLGIESGNRELARECLPPQLGSQISDDNQ